jgi:predicted acetyltransferase
MIEAEHAAMRARGEAMALLYASEFPIYGRFGYGNATRWARWTVDATRTGIVAGEGTDVSLVKPDEAIRDELRDFYDTWRRRQPAELRRRDIGWGFRIGLEEDAWEGRWKGWLAVHRDAAGAVDGYAQYGAEGRWENHVAKGRLDVSELLAADEEAERSLWAHLLTRDLVATVRASQRPADDRIGWRLTNPRAASVDELGDALWVRLFDVPRALAARGYEREGRLVLDVIDADATGGRTRVVLDATPDGATCTTTDASPDIALPVTALGSVYLGAHDLRDVVLRTGADEHRAGALDEAARLFRTAREPWCSTFF